ncbi:30288_t:CDS:2, partial [Racocetra persica]
YLRVSAERSSFSFISGDDEATPYKPTDTYDGFERDSREISFPVSDEDLAISVNNF